MGKLPNKDKWWKRLKYWSFKHTWAGLAMYAAIAGRMFYRFFLNYYNKLKARKFVPVIVIGCLALISVVSADAISMYLLADESGEEIIEQVVPVSSLSMTVLEEPMERVEEGYDTPQEYVILVTNTGETSLTGIRVTSNIAELSWELPIIVDEIEAEINPAEEEAVEPESEAETVENPAEEAVAESVEEGMNPAEETVAEPVEEGMNPAEEAVAESVEEGMNPAEEAVAEPVEEGMNLAEEAVAEPVEEGMNPAEETVAEPVEEGMNPAEEAVAEPVEEGMNLAEEAVAEPESEGEPTEEIVVELQSESNPVEEAENLLEMDSSVEESNDSLENKVLVEPDEENSDTTDQSNFPINEVIVEEGLASGASFVIHARLPLGFPNGMIEDTICVCTNEIAEPTQQLIYFMIWKELENLEYPEVSDGEEMVSGEDLLPEEPETVEDILIESEVELEPEEPESEPEELEPEPEEPESEAGEPESEPGEPESEAGEPEPESEEPESEAGEPEPEAGELEPEVGELEPEPEEQKPEPEEPEPETETEESEAETEESQSVLISLRREGGIFLGKTFFAGYGAKYILEFAEDFEEPLICKIGSNSFDVKIIEGKAEIIVPNMEDDLLTISYIDEMEEEQYLLAEYVVCENQAPIIQCSVDEENYKKVVIIVREDGRAKSGITRTEIKVDGEIQKVFEQKSLEHVTLASGQQVIAENVRLLELPLGEHKIEVATTDNSGNSSRESFDVEIIPDDVFSVLLPTDFTIHMNTVMEINTIESDDIVVCNRSEFPIQVNIAEVMVNVNSDNEKKKCQLELNLFTKQDLISYYQLSEGVNTNLASFNLAESNEDTKMSELIEIMDRSVLNKIGSEDYACLRVTGTIAEGSGPLWKNGDLNVRISFKFERIE